MLNAVLSACTGTSLLRPDFCDTKLFMCRTALLTPSMTPREIFNMRTKGKCRLMEVQTSTEVQTAGLALYLL